MKFLCDSCKAKYQIADEKVAGKTVRMKCRKCGHLIEIRANSALAEATQFRSLPSEELSRVYEEPGGEGEGDAGPAVQAPTGPAATRASVPARPSGAAAPRVSSPGAKPAAPAGAGASAQTPKPAASPIRPTAPAPTRPAATAPRAGAAAPGRATAGASTAPAAAAGGLAGAFNRAVDEPAKVTDDSVATRAVDLASIGGLEEWYVGINGTPIGPIRLSEMKSRSAAGEVTEESLVWRDTFDEWVALRTVPELAEMFRAVQQERNSLRPPAGVAGRSVRAPAPAPRDKAPLGSSSPGLEAAPLTGKSDRPDEANNAALFGLAPAVDASADPFAAPAAPAHGPTNGNGNGAAHLNGNGAAHVSVGDPFADPFAAPAPPTTAPFGAGASDENDRRGAAFIAPVAVGAAPIEGPRPVAPARIPVAAWVAIVLALATGVVAGSILFSKPAEQTVKIVTVIASASTPSAPVSVAAVDTGAPDTAPGDPTRTDPGNTGRKPVTGPGGALPKSTATTTAGAGGGGPALVLPPLDPNPVNTNSPNPNPTTQGPAPTSSETIPASRLQDVVNSNRNSLKRACWEPALSARGGAAGSAKVVVNFTIGGNGRVKSASASGGDSYPTLGPCLAGRIRNWTFPSGYAETASQASFSFVSQG